MKIPNLATLRDWCISKFQPKGDYLTSVPDEYITETELSEKNYVTSTEVADGLNEKVDKVEGKGLSTNDFTDEDKALLENIAEGAVSGVKGNAENKYRTGNVNLTAGDIGALPVDGNAASATKAERDSDGNIIKETYTKKTDLPTKVSELENDSGYATDEELKKTTELAAINKQTLGYSKKNLVKNTAVTKTINGVTFTINDDSSVTVKGTTTAGIGYKLCDGKDIKLEKGKRYILSGSPNNPNCAIKIATEVNGVGGAVYVETTGGKNTLFTYDGTLITTIDIMVRNVGTTVNNLTFYPMIRSADIEDGTYEPYVDDVDTRLDKIDNSILNTLEEIEANTDPDMIASALVVKELYNLVKNK